MDDRTYIRLHDGMPDHPKVVDLSHGAFRLYVESMCWSSRHLTDGVVPLAAMRKMYGWSAGALRELKDAALFENGTPKVVSIHDYTEHQRTAAAVAAAKAAKRQAAAAANHRQWHEARGLTDPSCSFCTVDEPSQDPSFTGRMSEHSPVSEPSHEPSDEPSLNLPEETEKDKDLKSKPLVSAADRPPESGSDQDPEFVAFWSAYPRKVGKGKARKAWRTALASKKASVEHIIAESGEYAAECRRKRTEKDFIAHPATWLNGERYNDRAEEAAAKDDGTPDDSLWDAPWLN